jgi:hypothetical protein
MATDNGVLSRHNAGAEGNQPLTIDEIIRGKRNKVLTLGMLS